MKILLANKFYYPRGGDCIYTINLAELLRSKGHEVAIFSMQHPDNLPSVWEKCFPSEVRFVLGHGMVKTFTRPFGTSEVRNKFNKLLDDFTPDVVHINNIHSQLSPIIVESAHQRGIRVVWTLHDYKLLCPRYDFLRNGTQLCDACLMDKRSVLKYSCMKNSHIGSFLAYKEAMKWTKERLEHSTDCFLCPSEFMMEKMKQGGFESGKLKVLHNFIDIKKCERTDYRKEDYYCYVGRLSHEKGLKTLIQAAASLPYRLKIIGTGPLYAEFIHSAATDNIEFMGYKEWNDIKELVGKARLSVLPSEWYENGPLSVIESLCLGTPVLGARIGGIPELIQENVNGLLFEPGNVEDLKNKMKYCWNELPRSIRFDEIAVDAQTRFSSERYYDEVMSIYQLQK